MTRHLVDDGADPRFLPTGHLIFGRAGTLMAVPMDRQRLEVTGTPVVVLGDVMQALNGNGAFVNTRAMQATVSSTGTLVYLRGGMAPDNERQLAWLDREGKATMISGAGTRSFFAVRLSPDERAAVITTRGRTGGVHLLDVVRGTLQTLPDSGGQLWPIWSPDGKHVLHFGGNWQARRLVSSPADGSRPATGIVGDRRIDSDPVFWSADGATLYGHKNGLQSINLADGRVTPIPNLSRRISHPGIVGMKRRLGLHGNVMARPAPPLFYALPVSRRGAYREANGHGDYRTGSA